MLLLAAVGLTGNIALGGDVPTHPPLHENELIQTRAGEGESLLFCFPRENVDDALFSGYTPPEESCESNQRDHLRLLDFGVAYTVSGGGKITSSKAAGDFTIDSEAKFRDAPFDSLPLQISDAAYSTTDDVVKIVQRAETVSGTKSIIYTIKVTNTDTSSISDLRIGVYTDWDIGTSDDDFAAYDRKTDIAYQFDVTDMNAYVGIASPKKSSAHHLSRSSSLEVLYGLLSVTPPLGEGFTGDATDVLGKCPNDVVCPNNVAAFGPVDTTVSLAWSFGKLNPNKTITLHVILAAGIGLQDLQDEIKAAKVRALSDDDDDDDGNDD